MPYAHNGIVQQDPIVGGVEITDEQFLEAVEGMCAGLIVSVEGGFKIVEAPEPAPVLPTEPSREDMANSAFAKRDYLLTIAGIRIAPLQAAIDLNIATESEISRLAFWKKYLVDLNRVEQQDEFPVKVDWPVDTQ